MCPAARLERHLELLRSRPYFDVELSARCNLRCRPCPREALRRAPGHMDDGTLSLLAAWLPPRARVNLGGLGEPLVHPRACEAVRALKERGHTVALTTNASLLTPATAEGLVDAGLDVLYASVLARDPALHEALMAGADAARIEAHLEHWARIRPPGLRCYLNVTLFDENRGELAALERYAARLGFVLHRREAHSRGGALYRPRGHRAPECGIFAKVAFVAWNGDLLACCNDLAGSTRLGGLAELPFEGLRELKRRILVEGSWFEPCAACDDAYRSGILGEGARAFFDREDRGTS